MHALQERKNRLHARILRVGPRFCAESTLLQLVMTDWKGLDSRKGLSQIQIWGIFSFLN